MSVERTSGATMKGKTLLPGHTLWNEGDAVNGRGFPVGFYERGGSGRARCSCGALSDVLPNRAQRKRWHREHKEEMRAEIASSRPTGRWMQ